MGDEDFVAEDVVELNWFESEVEAIGAKVVLELELCEVAAMGETEVGAASVGADDTVD